MELAQSCVGQEECLLDLPDGVFVEMDGFAGIDCGSVTVDVVEPAGLQTDERSGIRERQTFDVDHDVSRTKAASRAETMACHGC